MSYATTWQVPAGVITSDINGHCGGAVYRFTGTLCAMSTQSASQSREKSDEPRGSIDRFFHISERGSTIAREVRGGLVTFFAMSYIILLNPIILGGTDATGQYLGGGTEGPNTAMVAAATALVAGVMTIAMGVVANYPLALAAGLGLNAIVAFTIAVATGTGGAMTWADAMGLVVISGLLITVLVLTGFREAVFRAVPDGLKTAISVGIGLFIAFIGFYNAGFVRPGAGTPTVLGINGRINSWPLLVFVFGLMLVFILLLRKVKGALLISIVAASVLAIILNAVFKPGQRLTENGAVVEGTQGGWASNVPEADIGQLAAWPDLGLIGQFDLLGGFEKLGIVTVVSLVFSIMLADFFDTMGTMVAIGKAGDLLDESGTPFNVRRILVVDALGAAAGGAGSISSNTGYVESSAGVAEGARTGLANVVTGLCFLLAVFLAPLVALVPAEAAAPALVVVGFLMLSQIVDIDWKKLEVAIPAFLTIAVMPFAYSITVGLGVGFISYVILMTAKGKIKSVHPLMWFIAALFIVYFTVTAV